MNELIEMLTRAHLAILGKTGSGKTYKAKGYVEKLIAAGRRVCVVDPTGAWGGLKSSADGKHPGLPVVVIGGDGAYTDLPLTEHAGGAIAQLVGSGDMAACVLDLSALTISAQHRFMERFLEELYRVNKGVLHLVIDEADEFAPQSAMPGTERVLGATSRIVQRGRIKGFRVMLISQRPAVLNKRVLTQCNALVAMRLPAPQDRKAIEEWVKGQADEDQAKELLASLSKLQRGEGWVWAPEDGILKRETSAKITTFDSGKTPDGTDEVATPKKFAELDLSGLKSALATAIKEADENDPKKLRARIAELERAKGEPAASPAVDVQAIRDEAWEASYKQHFQGMCDTFMSQMGPIRGALLELMKAVRVAELHFGNPGLLEEPPVESKQATPASGPQPAPRVSPARESARAGDWTGPQRECLDAFAWFAAIGIDEPTREQICFRCGWRSTSGHIKNVLGSLRSAGMVDGWRLVGSWPAPAIGSLAQYHDQIRKTLDGPKTLVFDLLLSKHPRELTKEQVCAALGWTETSGHIKNVVGGLRSFGVVEKRGWKLSPMVFPKGLR